MPHPEQLEEYLPIVKKIGERLSRKLPGSVDVDDLIQYGFLGLRQAWLSFDPSRGTKFSTYCQPRIRGAMIDGLRDEDWVPRLERGRNEEVRRMRSMDEVVFEGGRTKTLIDQIEDESVSDPGASLEETDWLSSILRCLPSTHREVIRGVYGRDLNQAECAREIGLSESRISQLHTQALRILRARIPMETQVNNARELSCDRIPDTRFSIPGAARTAGVTVGELLAAIDDGKPVGPHAMTFKKDIPESPKILPSPIQLDGQFRQFVCDDFPGVRFSITEAAETASVSKGRISQAVGMNRVGPHRLLFRRDGMKQESDGSVVSDDGIPGGRVGHGGRPTHTLICDQHPGRTFTMQAAADLAGVGYHAIPAAVRRGAPTGAQKLVFRKAGGEPESRPPEIGSKTPVIPAIERENRGGDSEPARQELKTMLGRIGAKAFDDLRARAEAKRKATIDAAEAEYRRHMDAIECLAAL